MTSPSFASLPPAIADALSRQGFTALTKVQEAVLDPALVGRDLRIASQTGSGKTVAVGLVLVPAIERASQERAAASAGASSGAPAAAAPVAVRPVARPAAILIAPTRELAAQLARELTWLFAPLHAKVCAVTGGTGYAHELRALRQGPLVVVGTPGRLLDHLERGSIDPSSTGAVVLDEADQMLDLGFRDELDAILGKLPAERRTHLVFATFSREVRALADRYQNDPVEVEGTRIGAANQDISHIAHLVRPDERGAVVINLLLLAPGERTLVFVRTRADTTELADKLIGAGFRARALSGELEQSERTRTLNAFRSGAITTLVATDVAARGLDVPEVGRVIHADPPNDPEVFTHRSGRTGRAGRKGTSIVLVPPQAREPLLRLFRRARVEVVFRPAPGPADVLRAADERLYAELHESLATPDSPAEGQVTADSAAAAPATSPSAAKDMRLRALAERLLGELDATDLVTALLARGRDAGPCAPLPVTVIAPPSLRPVVPPPVRKEAAVPRSFVPFRINWGERQGADARRLLAMVCRRGGINGSDIGAIHIGAAASTFEVASTVAVDFARAVKQPDARDPRIRIDPLQRSSVGFPAPRGRSGPHTPYNRPRRPAAPPA